MNRKIHTIVCDDENAAYVKLDGVLTHVAFEVSETICKLSPKIKTVEFARRSIANGQKLTFKLTRKDGWKNEGFRSNPGESDDIWLCPDKCQEILGVGKNTKQFSIWVRPVVK